MIAHLEGKRYGRVRAGGVGMGVPLGRGRTWVTRAELTEALMTICPGIEHGCCEKQ